LLRATTPPKVTVMSRTAIIAALPA
jgi:hypothetical protein